MRKYILCTLALAVLSTPLLILSQDTSKQALPTTVKTADSVYYAGPEAGDVSEMAAWIKADQDRQVAEYLAAVEAERIQQEQERIQRELEEQRKSRAASQIAPAPMGQCCGPHTDLWWQGVAQCEQSGNNHPFFGYFSIMDGSAGGLPWSVQVAMANAILARAGREVPTWAASCVAMGYQYSPGG